MRKSDDVRSGPSSTMTTARPARASDLRRRRRRPRRCRRCRRRSRVSRSAASRDASIDLPARREACAERVRETSRSGRRHGCVINHLRSADPRRAGIADACPRARIAVPGREDQLMQRVVSAALQRPAAVAPAIEERGDFVDARLRPGRGDAGERAACRASARAARTAGRARPAPKEEVPGSRGRRCRRSPRSRRCVRVLRRGSAPSSIAGTMAATIDRASSSSATQRIRALAKHGPPAGGRKRRGAGDAEGEEGAAAHQAIDVRPQR